MRAFCGIKDENICVGLFLDVQIPSLNMRPLLQNSNTPVLYYSHDLKADIQPLYCGILFKCLMGW